MTRTARSIRMALAAALAAVAVSTLLSAGCTKPKEAKLEPQVKPPAIGAAGVLSVGVDLKTPPFAGVDGERQAGFDIDVAAALAERLGLSVRYVDVAPSQAASALAQGKVDAVMSVPLNTSSLTSLALAGSYAVDGPAFFVSTDSTASVVPSLTLDTVHASAIGVQRSSEAYWYLRSELGSDAVKPYDTLRFAIEAADAGEVELVAGDAFVAAYIARDFPTVHFAGQVKPATPLSVAVAADNTVLDQKVRSALDALAADGVFDVLRRKWVGGLPELTYADASSATTDTQ